MTDHEALQIIMKVTDLRMSAAYQAAEALRRRSRVETMARSDEHSIEHAAVRLLIGTWDRIAMFAQDFNESQRRRFFRCNPVRLIWRTLGPAIIIIRQSSTVGPRFAKEFEELATRYDEWTLTQDGQEFRTEAEQNVCALFA